MHGTDGYFYVVKAANNPQGRRTLVNDWMGSHLLRSLGVRAADCRLVHITDELISTEDLHLVYGNRRVRVDCGPHFGSVCPVNPEIKALFDYLPARLFSAVKNIEDFLTTLAFDIWTSNVDLRQAVFFRSKSHVFEALMTDNGMIFQGVLWGLDGVVPKPIAHKNAYQLAASRCSVDYAIEKISALRQDFVEHIVDQIPPEWIQNDRDDLLRLIERLFVRRKRLPALLCDFGSAWLRSTTDTKYQADTSCARGTESGVLAGC